MTTSDLDTLVDMGFEPERSELAIKHGGGLQGAIDWLDKNQDKSLDEINQESQPSSSAAASDGMPALQPGEEPRSLVCDDCGRKLRSHAQAEFHATKTGHDNFSESTEEIAPLTQEEKDAKLAELRAKLAAKRGDLSEQDKLDRKRNEHIRQKSTKEIQDIKEDLVKKEQMKEAAAKKREKIAELEAKKRIQAKIAQDKEDRRAKAEREKAARMGQTFPIAPVVRAMEAPKPSNPKPASAYTEARLRLQTANGTVMKTFPAETTLIEVAHAVTAEKGVDVTSFVSNFPKKIYDASDFGMTLKEAGLVPSAALIVK